MPLPLADPQGERREQDPTWVEDQSGSSGLALPGGARRNLISLRAAHPGKRAVEVTHPAAEYLWSPHHKALATPAEPSLSPWEPLASCRHITPPESELALQIKTYPYHSQVT